jgi:mannose-6-phosphate isomerase-like protein (cupin superfamily)
MHSPVIVANTSNPADVHGVHGADGLTHWTCLARRAALHGAWEAVEWASLPPGGASGEHLHTRTEEVYLLLSGRGEIALDGRRSPVAAGDLVLTGLGTTHGLRNTGDGPLDWLVIEITAATPSPTDPLATEEQLMHSTVVNDLRRAGPIDPRPVLSGPLRVVEVVGLSADRHAEFSTEGVEHTVFVTGGRGLARSHRNPAVGIPLNPGSALTLPLGSGATVTAGPDGLEYVHAVLAVPPPEPAEPTQPTARPRQPGSGEEQP